MVSLLADKMEAIRHACKHFNVVQLDIFGSALSEDYEPNRSDIDFPVDFGPMPPPLPAKLTPFQNDHSNQGA